MPPIEPIVRNRECKGCGDPYPEPYPWHRDMPEGFGQRWSRGYCSRSCEVTKKRAEATPRRTASLVTRAPVKAKRRSFTPASPEQRESVRSLPCLVDASHFGVEPAHLIDRMTLTVGQEDPRAVVPLCRPCHRAYDDGDLDLLIHLEPRFSVELAFAVERFGLVSTLRRVTNERQA